MRITTRVTLLFLLGAGIILLGAESGNCEGPVPCYGYENKNCSEIRVTGHSQGNHELDCTVIRPWRRSPTDEYPVIGWANGWNFGNVVGEHTTEGYKPGLIEWALDGPYIVVAANQWSVQESDVLACVQWVVDQNTTENSEYQGVVNTGKIGLAGHSQGGGAVIKAGDGEPNGLTITAVVAMNPYGPGWVNPENQDGPMLLLGGNDDTTTPPDSYDAVWEAIFDAHDPGPGGVNAVLEDGTHNSEAWGSTFDEDGEETTMGWEDAQEVNFGRYQDVTELWWRFHLNDNARSIHRLMRLLSRDPWNQEPCCDTLSTDNFDLD